MAYFVEMRLSSQLNNLVDYVFAVAAENDIGVREFSNASSPAHLGERTHVDSRQLTTERFINRLLG